MVSSTNQKRARLKISERRIRKSATVVAELAADIEAEVNGDGDSLAPTLVVDTPPIQYV